MNTQTLVRHFESIGARLKVSEAGILSQNALRRRMPVPRDCSIDIGHDRQGEFFSLLLGPAVAPILELTAIDIRPKERHLLLMAKRLDLGLLHAKSKFLCGHDERHWFVAEVPEIPGIATVAQAMEALKPEAVRQSQVAHGVGRKKLNRRANTGYVRQGEWFFLPRPDFSPSRPMLILRDEPIMRTGGKPHMVEELFREGGQIVYVCRLYPGGLTQKQYDEVMQGNRGAASWNWRAMRRNPLVYARGRIRHPDHATVILPFWHVIVMSAEERGPNVAFLD